MISEGEKEEIRQLIQAAKRRSLNFGLCLGEEPIETVFVMHRRNIPAALARLAKAEGTTPKVAKGRMEVKNGAVRLACEGRVPTGLTKNLKKYLKLLKLSYKVELADDVPPLPDEEEEEEVAAAEQPTDTAETVAPDEAAQETEKEETPEAAEQTDQTRYEEIAVPMAGQIQQLLQDEHPKAAKISAIWELAQMRAEGGDYRTALKAVRSLSSML